MIDAVRRRLVLISALFALLASGLPALAGPGLPAAAGATPQPSADLFQLREGTEVEALAVGSEGYLWFAGANHGSTPSNVVGRISPAGAVDEYTVPETASVPGIGGLTRGPEGDMWFTEPAANRVERVAPTGHPEGFTLPVPGSRPTGIVTAPGGFVWVTMTGSGRIAQIDPAGLGTETNLPPGSRPGALALGADTALWAIETETATLTRISLQLTSANFPLPSNGAFFKGAINADIVAGPDGDLWLAQSDGPYVGEVIPTETQPEYIRYSLPTGHGTTLISNGPNGDIWFVSGNEIGSISPRSSLKTVEIGDPACPLAGCAGPIAALSEGPEGGLWFASGETVGRYHPIPLFVALGGKLSTKRKGVEQATATVECRGGAAAQRCKGKLELLPGKGGGRPLGRGRFAVATMKSGKATVKLSAVAAARLAAKGSLPVQLVAKLGGKVSSKRRYTLRAGR
jgi:streptogramin lyase